MRLGKLQTIQPLARLCGDPETRRGRLLQLAFGLWQLVSSFGAPRRRVLIAGEGLLHMSGEVTVTTRAVTRNAIRSLVTGQPVVLLRSTSNSALRALCASMKIDETNSLRAVLSPNPVSVFFARRAGVPVVVHAAPAGASWGVSSHLAGLQMARARVPSVALQAIVPTLVECTRTVGVDVVIETYLPGKPYRIRATSDQDLERDIQAALPPLKVLHEDGRRTRVAPDQAHIDNALPGLIRKWPQYAPELRASLVAVSSWSRNHLPAVLVHGDYWLGNVLFDGDPPHVTGILDWDCARPNGCAGYDALHLVLVTVAMHRGHSVARCLEEVWTKNWSSDLLPRMLAEIQRTFELAPGDLERLAALLWLTLLWQRNLQRDARWQDDMIGRPAGALLRWCALFGRDAPMTNSDYVPK